MSGDFVVVVDADLSAYRALCEGLPADTYDVVSVATARAGFNVACALDPLVIVASLDLPDADANELSMVIRGHDTRVAYTPIVVLTAKGDEATRLAVLENGADVVLSAPVDPAELVAQVNAMIAMTERIRELERVQSLLPPASDGQSFALIGDPTKMSIASVLGALELEQRTGELRFAASPQGDKLSIHVASGVLGGGLFNGRAITALDALKRALVWEGTQFGFIATDRAPPPPFGQPLGSLLLAAFNETSPSDRLAHELEASRRLLGDSIAGMSLAELRATTSIKLSETGAGLRLEETAAGRKFLADTAAGLRLGMTSTGIKLGETAAGLKLSDTAAGIRVGNPSAGKVAPAPQEIINTLTSFHESSASIPAPIESEPRPSMTPVRISRPDLTPEKAAMRQTLRGLEVGDVKPSGS